MGPILNLYKKYVPKFTNYTISLEQEVKIRDDFIEFYDASLSSKSKFHLAYSAKPKNWYYDRIIEWGERARKYNPFKIFEKKADDAIDDIENVGDLFSLLDLIRSFLPWLTGGLFILTISNEYLSIFFLASSAFFIFANGLIEMFRLNSKSVVKVIDTLIFTNETVLREDGTLPDKEKLYGPYIWNRSLSNPSTMGVYIFLLYFKKIFPGLYNKIKKTAISIYPKYMASISPSTQKVSRMNFLLFLIKNRKLIKR
jgi:hypothetical protein